MDRTILKGGSFMNDKVERTRSMISVREAAQIAGVGKNTMYTLVHSGQLPSVRIGRTIRISYAALLRFLGLTEEIA